MAKPWPIYPAASPANWVDHFPGSTLDSTKWGTITSGTGSVTVTDSYADANCGGTSAAAAIYYKNKIDKTKSQLWLAAVSFPTIGAAAGVGPFFMALLNGGSAPVADTTANINAKVVMRRQGANQSSLAILDQYLDTGGTVHYWDGQGGSPAWVTSYTTALASQMPIRDDDYYVCGLEIDGQGQRFRTLGWGQSFPTAGTYTFDQGWRLFALSDWVLWSNVRDSSSLWLVFGAPYTDDTGSTHECRVEWVKYIEPVLEYKHQAWSAAKKQPAASNAHRIRHYYSYDGALYVPDDRTTWAIDLGSGGSWDDTELQEPWAASDGTNFDYLYYNGANATTNSLGVARASHVAERNSQVGPWTKSPNNPILSVGGAGADDELAVGFPRGFCDYTENDPSKRYKLLYSGKKASDGKWRMLYATARDPFDDWTKRGTVINVGGAGANDEHAARDGIILYKDGLFIIIYEAWDANNVTHAMWASGPTLDNLTKQGTWFSSPATATDQALTANMSTAPGRTVSVGSTTGFAVDAMVALAQSTSLDNWSTSKIRKIVNSTTIELYHGITGFTTTYPARIKQMDSSPNMTPRNAYWDGARWCYHLNYWELFFNTAETATYAAVIEEGYFLTHAAEHPTGAQPVIDYLSSPTISRGFNNDSQSNENMTILMAPFGPFVPTPPMDHRQRRR